ncbi:MAG: DUF420 domain-containing protein [Thermoplasmatota archaeon]
MGFLGTKAADVTDVTIILLVIAAIIITWAWSKARKGDGTRHHYGMIAGVTVAWLFFLAYMLGSFLHATTTFNGPSWARLAWWYPLIAVHSLAATIVLVWSLYQIWSGFRYAIHPAPREWAMEGQNRRHHAKGGKGFLTLWYITTATGILVYLTLYVIWP